MHVIGSLKRVNQGNCRENPLDGLELEEFWSLTDVERQELLSGKTQSHRLAIAALLKFYLFVTYGLHACKAAYLLPYRELPKVGNRNFCSFVVSVMMTPKTVSFEKTCSLDKAMACNGASIMQSAGTSIPVFRAIATHMPKP